MMKSAGFLTKLQDCLTPVATKLDREKHIIALKNGLMLVIPATIIGGIFLILASPPISATNVTGTNIFLQFMLAWKSWANTYSSFLMLPYNLTMGLLGIYTLIGVSYFYAKECKLNTLNTSLSSLIVYLVVSSSYKDGNLVTAYLGPKGIFTAIVVGLLTVEISRILIEKKWIIRFPKEVPPMVAAPFEILVPLAVNLLLFMGVNGLLGLVGTSIPTLLVSVISPLLKASNSLGVMLFLVFLQRFLWFFGIHGGNVLSAVIMPLITMNVTLNAAEVAAGNAPTAIFSGYFLNIFSNWCMLNALAVVLLVFTKSTRLKSIGKVALIPDFFNINEPMTFGIPIVANISLLIPYVVIPVFNITIAYFAATFGLIGNVYIMLPATTPAVLASFLGTMDWRAPVLFVILCVIDVMMWTPFIKNYDKLLVDEEAKNSAENAEI
jgi:PTS system cellobiose-specific IIC component